VQYKKMEMIVEAFSGMPDKRLCVIGDGPEFNKISAKTGKNVTMMGYQVAEVVRNKMQSARALIFAAKEDFGIVPVEAQACGTPVIAYGVGGALESIRNLDQTRPTGLFFYQQSVEALQAAVIQFEKLSHLVSPIDCRENAMRFSSARFREEYHNTVEEFWEQFLKEKN